MTQSGFFRREVPEIYPENFAEVERIVRNLKRRVGIIVDFNGIPVHIARRMLDFLSGAVFACGGKINKLDYKRYLLVPGGVEINAARK